MVNIDIDDDVRESYKLDVNSEDITLNNVTHLQNHSKRRISIIVDGRRWFVEGYSSVSFSEKSNVEFRKRGNIFNRMEVGAE